VVLVDEVAFLTAYQADRKLRERTLAALATLTTQGRAAGYCVVAALQDPRKEVLNIRNLFPDKIALRLDEPSQAGKPASASTKSTVASVIRRLFAWAREERVIPFNPALELRTGWGGSVRRRVIIPSIPQVLRLAEALNKFKPGLGDVAMVLAFTGLRWEEAVAVLIESVNLDDQAITIERTASESGGRRDVREDMKTRAAVRTVMIPDIAMPAIRRLVERGATGREKSNGRLYGRLINGDRGGYLGYATWRKYLSLAHGYTAAHKDGAVKYTAHELRHVCASLLIASGATDMQVAHQMGHSKVETTKNIYGHLFAQDRASILDAMNEAVSRLHAYEENEPSGGAQAEAA
jgi:integrase